MKIKKKNIYLFTLILFVAQMSLSKVSNCVVTNTASQISIEAQKQIAKKYSVVNAFSAYEFALPFQISSSDNLKPLPGEDQIAYRKRLLNNRKVQVSEANTKFTQFLNQNRLSHVYIQGPQNMPIWTIKAKVSELEYILKASDACDIYKIATVLVN